MPHSIRRLYSQLAHTPTASEAAAQFLQRFTSLPPRTQSQYLDLNQLQLLAATLNRPLPILSNLNHDPNASLNPATSPTNLPKSRSHGLAIPPSHHLAYFTPAQPEAQLGRDGTDTSYNPAAPFTRRMWAGGSVSWDAKNRLRVGQTATETTRVLSAEGKRTRDGEEMVVVGVEKSFGNADGLAVVDRRNWIFRPEIVVPKAFVERPEAVPFPDTPEGAYVKDFVQTPVSLFRFSAVTFNGHKIHYNREWCREVEGHRECVVHGPLNLVNMVDFWRDVTTQRIQEGEIEGQMEDELVPKSITYRATSPLYAGERYRIILEAEKEMIMEVKVIDGYGKLSMRGMIERF